MPNCSVRESLQRKAADVLDRLISVTQGQRRAVVEGDHEMVQTLDHQLEQLFGEKERSFGALWEHIKEHGC